MQVAIAVLAVFLGCTAALAFLNVTSYKAETKRREELSRKAKLLRKYIFEELEHGGKFLEYVIHEENLGVRHTLVDEFRDSDVK